MFSYIRSFISKRRTHKEMEKKGLVGSRKRKTQEDTLARAAERSKILGLTILTLVWFVSIAVLMLPNPRSETSALVMNQIAPKSIFAGFNFSYIDDFLTEENRKKAKELIPLYYNIDAEITEECILGMEELFAEIKKRTLYNKKGQLYNPPPDSKAGSVVLSMDDDVLNGFLQMISDEVQKKIFLRQLEQILSKGIINQSDKGKHTYGQKIRVIDSKGRRRIAQLVFELLTPNEASEKIIDSILELYSPRNKKILRQVMVDAVSTVLIGNLEKNEKATELEREIVAKNTPDVERTVAKGDTLITKGRKIDEKDLVLLKYYFGLLEKRTETVNFWRRFSESTIMSLLLMVLTGIYLYHIHPEVVKSNQKMWLIGVSIMVSMLLNYLFLELFNKVISPDMNIQPSLVVKMLPLGTIALLLSVLIGLRVAVYIGLFTSIIAAVMLGNSFDLVIQGLLVSCIGGFAVRYSKNYRSFFLRGFFAIAITLLVIDLTSLWEVIDAPSDIIWTMAIMSCINGLISAILALIFLFIFEALFQVSTNMTLLMLCDYNHPLLKRLQLEAPGTYHHSLMVSTLAEHAAQEIGANPIEARVGALFHDIGKLTKPEYFTENNTTGENKHQELHPRMSSLIILNHVKEGVDMAIKYKLRKIIRDAIEQHHGTDLIFYFYKRAVEENSEKENPVEEQEYRYNGPLPKQKEVALISLADACEAASRSLQKPTHAKVDALVWEIFRKRIRNGQLDEANLTFGELAKVRSSFVKTLTTMLHGRIAYPKEEEDEQNEDDLFMAAKQRSTKSAKGSVSGVAEAGS